MCCTRLHPGHLSVCGGDGSQHSEEIVENLCVFECNYYYYSVLVQFVVNTDAYNSVAARTVVWADASMRHSWQVAGTLNRFDLI